MRQRRDFDVINLLSVIVPTYLQEKTIVKDIQNIQQSLDTLGLRYEIIVVIDGMVDNTYKQVEKLKSKHVKILGYKANQGKGHAVRYGMLQARGDVIGFIDAGMDINPNGFSMLLQHMRWYNADIIVGSKMHPVSKVNYPLRRKILSRGYRLITKILFGFSVRDTQVGLKFFRKNVVKDVLPRLLVKTHAFDVELLAVAYMLGYTRIYEAPVEINFQKNKSTIKSVWKTVFLMLWDTAAVFNRLKILHYYDDKNKDNWKYEPDLNFNMNVR